MSMKLELSYYQQMQLRQVKYLNDVAYAFQNRSQNNQVRKHMVDAQKINNYSPECERIRNHHHNSATPALNRDSLAAREAHLKSMGARAADATH